MVTYTFNSPITITTGFNQTYTVAAVEVTGVSCTITPTSAPAKSGALSITLTDPVTGYQTTITYNDSSVYTFFQTVATPPANSKLGDIVAEAMLTKLQTDGKIPAGTIAIS